MMSDRVFLGLSLTLALVAAGTCFAAAVAIISPVRSDHADRAPPALIQVAAISLAPWSAQ